MARSTPRSALLVWVGLILLAAGGLMLLMPRLPATPYRGIQRAPQWPIWSGPAVMAVGVVLARFGRAGRG